MAEHGPSSAEEALRQARQHLESLQSAGVEWLPQAPLEVAAPAAAVPASLFEPTAPEGAAAGRTLAERRQALAVLAAEVAGCRRCPELVVSRSKTVFGDGPPGVELCFVGEAPGADEDAQGLPFVGAAGQLLNRIIAACGLKREEVYICNTLKCLHAYTHVLTEDGWKQVQAIVAKEYSGRVAAVDDEGRLAWARITGHYRAPLGGRKLVKLHLHSSRGGARITGGTFTDDHEILTERGYRRIRELDPERDRIHSGTYQPAGEVRQALVGMLLGDARFGLRGNSLGFGHSERQADYLRHKAGLLGGPAARITSYTVTNNTKGKTYNAVRFSCRATPFFRAVGKLFYPSGRKEITPACLREFTVISLAYLFMDDGYMRFRGGGRRPRAEIATCGFGIDEVELLASKIRDLGIPCYALMGGRYPRIHFDVESTAVLSRRIAPYLHPSLEYKLLPEHRAIAKRLPAYAGEPYYDTFDLLPAPEVYERTCRTVYCLGVEKYENFITRSGVVHNCRPPGNRTPTAGEMGNCRGFLERQLELVQPHFLCSWGGSSPQALLGTNQSLGRLRRRFHDYKGIPVLCTYHPAFLLPHRSPEKKRDVWEDMKLLLARMGRPVPPRRPGAEGAG